jgi:hypothetical protein
MLRKLGLVGILALIGAAAPVNINDTFPIKLKKSGQGDVTTHNKQEVEENSFKLTGPDGKALQERKETKTITEEYKETILEKAKGKKSTRLRREYTKATVKSGDNEKELPYQGKTLLLEKKDDGKFHFAIDGGEELKGKDIEQLNNVFNGKDGGDNESDENALEKALLPTKPVKVNDTWTIDADTLVKALLKESREPIPVDKSKIKGQGVLKSVHKKDGRLYGNFDIEVTLPLKGQLAMGKDLKANVLEGSKMTLRAKIDGCIDGSSSDSQNEMAMDSDINATFKGPDGNEYKMMIRTKQSGKETEKDLSAK